MKKSKLISALLFCLFTPGMAFVAWGWNIPGHMAVAGLAYDELSSVQQKKLADLIRQHHPAFHLIKECFPDDDIDDRDLVMAAATWPDLAKRAKKEGFIDNGYEESAPAVTKVEFDHKMHKGYHFVDRPLWVGTGDPPPLPEVPRVNATGVVNVLVTQLKSGEGDPARAYDLGWLLHLVGDLHQPLHAVTGVTATCPDGDRGGNKVDLTTIAHGGVTDGAGNLHAFWDDVLGKTAESDSNGHARLDLDAMTADEIIDAARKIKLPAYAEKLQPSVWAKESFDLAKRDVYSIKPFVAHDSDGDEILRVTLTEEYHKTAVRDAKRRIRIAGHRLALLLKQIL